MRGKEEREREKKNKKQKKLSHRRRHARASQRHADVGGKPDDDFPRGEVPRGDRASQGAAFALAIPLLHSPPLLLLLSLRFRRGRFGAGRGIGDKANADIGMPARGADPIDEGGAREVFAVVIARAPALSLLARRRKKRRNEEQEEKEKEEEGGK